MEVSCSDHSAAGETQRRSLAAHCCNTFPGLICAALNLLQLGMQKGYRRHKSPSLSHNVSMQNSSAPFARHFFTLHLVKRRSLLRAYFTRCMQLIMAGAPSGINCLRCNLSSALAYLLDSLSQKDINAWDDRSTREIFFPAYLLSYENVAQCPLFMDGK
jgi:hypothetical protein